MYKHQKKERVQPAGVQKRKEIGRNKNPGRQQEVEERGEAFWDWERFHRSRLFEYHVFCYERKSYQLPCCW